MNDAERDGQDRFELLVIEHHVRLRAFVRSLGVDPDWVDDLAQEALLTAYREWESFDVNRDFGKWVRGIAANIVRNEIRKDARHRRILRGDLVRVLLGREPESSERVEPVSIVAIRDCMSRLPSRSRQLVQGRYRDGHRAPELARELGLSVDNVRQMLTRIRRQLRRCVELRVAQENRA